MVRSAAGLVWAEPRFPNPPGVYWRDWVIASVMVGLAVIETVFRDDVLWRPLALLLCLGIALTLPWRRTHPLAMVALSFGAIGTIDLVALLAGETEPFGLYSTAPSLLLVYALVRWGAGREIVRGLVLVLVVATLGVITDYTNIGEAIGGYGILAFIVALGAAVRYSTTSRRREFEQMRSQEREHLARDLHDTVAHHVSAIAVQAQAGRTLAATRPEAAVNALEVIEEAASRTLVEMRAMVGALRQGEDAEYGVRRGVANLEELAEELGGSPAVVVELRGDLGGLNSSLDATIYRIAQESITNAVRHARAVTRVDVRVIGEDGVVRLVVRDDGMGATAGGIGGFGLAGMAERAQLLGGTLEAGPAPDGGWRVAAELPRHRSADD